MIGVNAQIATGSQGGGGGSVGIGFAIPSTCVGQFVTDAKAGRDAPQQDQQQVDPNGQPVDPNGQPVDPNGQPVDPNGQHVDPNGQQVDPNGGQPQQVDPYGGQSVDPSLGQ